MIDQANGAARTPRDVFEDHLQVSTEGSLKEDLVRNYAPDLVVLTGRGVYRGHDYLTQLVEGDVAFLEWTARVDRARVDDGADSYVIRNGRTSRRQLITP